MPASATKLCTRPCQTLKPTCISTFISKTTFFFRARSRWKKDTNPRRCAPGGNETMPVQIGAKPHNFTDPTGLLSDCHRRVEMFLGTLTAVAEVLDRPATE